MGYYCWCCLEKPIRIARQKPLLYKFDIHQSLESFANISPKHILLNSNVICSNIFNFSTFTQDCGLPLNFKYILAEASWWLSKKSRIYVRVLCQFILIESMGWQRGGCAPPWFSAVPEATHEARALKGHHVSSKRPSRVWGRDGCWEE